MSRMCGVDAVSTSTSKYIIILIPKELETDIRSTLRANFYHSNLVGLLKTDIWLFIKRWYWRID